MKVGIVTKPHDMMRKGNKKRLPTERVVLTSLRSERQRHGLFELVLSWMITKDPGCSEVYISKCPR